MPKHEDEHLYPLIPNEEENGVENDGYDHNGLKSVYVQPKPKSVIAGSDFDRAVS